MFGIENGREGNVLLDSLCMAEKSIFNEILHTGHQKHVLLQYGLTLKNMWTELYLQLQSIFSGN